MKSSSSLRILLLITLSVALFLDFSPLKEAQAEITTTIDNEPFKCDGGVKTVEWVNYCDGVKDCEDGSDEEKCVTGEIELIHKLRLFLTFDSSPSTSITDGNFGVLSTRNESVEAFHSWDNLEVEFSPIFIGQKFPNLKEFLIAGGKVKKITRKIFKHLDKLEFVVLLSNEISVIESDSFVDLTGLKELFLNVNQLTRIDGNWFKNLQNLNLFFINSNQISSLDENIFENLKELTKIDMSHNQLTNLPPQLFQNNRKLVEIELNSNQIQEIPENFLVGLTNLEGVDFSYNQISILPPNLFRYSPNLKKISLESNYLKTLPQGVFQFNKHLERIWLEKNEIEKIDEEIFDGLEKLKIVELSGNKCIDKVYGDYYLESLLNFTQYNELKRDIKEKCK